VIEIKVAYHDKGDDPVTKAEEAFRQIEDNNYAKPFSNAICIGITITPNPFPMPFALAWL